MGLELDTRGSILGRGKVILFSVASRLVVGPTQFPYLWVAQAISPRYNSWGAKLAAHLCLLPTPRMAQVVPSLPLPHSWHSTWLIKHRAIFTFFYLISLMKCVLELQIGLQWLKIGFDSIRFEVMLPSACSFIVDGLTFSCRCSTLHISAYMAIFRCVWCFTFIFLKESASLLLLPLLHVVILCSF
jgi:hypothetical protein